MQEIKCAQVPRGVTDGARPVLELKEPHIAKVVKRALVEEVAAFLRAQLEVGFAPGELGLVKAVQVIFQGRFHPVQAQAVGPAVHLVLLDAQRRAHLEQLAPVVAVDNARVVLRVIRPVFQDSAQVGRIVHIAACIMTLLARHSMPFCRRAASQFRGLFRLVVLGWRWKGRRGSAPLPHEYSPGSSPRQTRPAPGFAV